MAAIKTSSLLIVFNFISAPVECLKLKSVLCVYVMSEAMCMCVSVIAQRNLCVCVFE